MYFLNFPIIISITILILLTLYKYSLKHFDYWKKKGVPYAKPLPLVGNFLQVLTFRSSIGHHLEYLYNKFDAPFFGVYLLNKPYLIVKSPELIKSILVTDFNSFPDRNIIFDEECDSILSQTLAFIRSSEWKPLRAKLTRVFSIAKMKNMINLITEAANEMNDYIERNKNKSFIEAKEVCSRYSTEVIASCAFGIKAHCFENENSEFRQIGRNMFGFNWRNAITQSSYLVAPGVAKFFKFSFFDRKVYDFMRKAFWTTFEERKKTNQKRNDLIDVINQIRKENTPEDNIKFEGDRAVAQAAIFYAAGFEPVSSCMAFVLYELCLHPDIQSKLRKEIKIVLSRYGELIYEAIQDLKYMEKVIFETLRKYPALPFLERISAEEYKIPDSDITLEKGTPIFIPMFGLYHDPKYYPEPQTFDPERFSDDGSENSLYQLAFGGGPRSCIGEKFGLMEIKIGLTRILSNYELERSENTPVPIEFETKCFLLVSKVGLPIKFKKIANLESHNHNR
ncbi:hypothetical protein ILUMI_26859 [Ignelater luminosus]|uniref:Cytochrome P450 n=1 Tax=Ignelater luminosus TaxID=2038154 RepID=A0A8K0C593_IGNLU|nr:hypothetical protein ILUMI_26859 [Ignelater luminosus]